PTDKKFMYLLLLRFEIPKKKLYEFNLALGRLVKWPVYTLHTTESNEKGKIFEFIRNWDSKEEMQKDLESQIFTNLMGVVKVLGHIHQSHIYNVAEDKDLLKVLE
ncbi:MAG: hypothetical protein KJN70_00770, partial [Eudoraea sp.]|nr:hypothetical protein [Eudoraea sp.]